MELSGVDALPVDRMPQRSTAGVLRVHRVTTCQQVSIIEVASSDTNGFDHLAVESRAGYRDRRATSQRYTVDDPPALRPGDRQRGVRKTTTSCRNSTGYHRQKPQEEYLKPPQSTVPPSQLIDVCVAINPRKNRESECALLRKKIVVQQLSG